MKSTAKISIFLLIFTIGFYILRTQGQYFYYNITTLAADLGGLTYLYSTVGIIFAIFAAFVILFEAERWNNLVDAVKGEVGELNELWLWSRHLPTRLRGDFDKNIKEYLEELISEGWHSAERGQKNQRIEHTLESLHTDIYKILKVAPDLMPEVFSTFSDLLKFREKRIHYSSFHLPKILKSTLLLSDVLLIGLSLLIAVHNPWLDYIFVGSVAALGYIIYLLVDDMDSPIRPGGWHITTRDYEELLAKITV